MCRIYDDQVIGGSDVGGQCEAEGAAVQILDFIIGGVVAAQVLHHVNAAGTTSPKVFKGAELRLAPGATTTIRKTISLAQHSTRTHHPGTHRVDAQLNGVVVELCAPPNIPFDDTPNPGGVYKAWVTPVGDFVGDPTTIGESCGNGCFHGFVPAASKTDNFKVADTRTWCIKARKDIMDKKNDVVPGVGWIITVTDSIGVTNGMPTDGSGNGNCI